MARRRSYRRRSSFFSKVRKTARFVKRVRKEVSAGRRAYRKIRRRGYTWQM